MRKTKRNTTPKETSVEKAKEVLVPAFSLRKSSAN
jgi:hypothetical protein